MITLDDHLPLQYPGPVSRRRTTLVKLIWLQVAIAGFGVALFSDSPRLQSFGLGMVFPGAGFIQNAAGGWVPALAQVGLTALSVLVFLIALFIWFWNGNAILPIAVWILAAIGAAWLHPRQTLSVNAFGSNLPLAPFLAVVITVLTTALLQRRISADRRKRTSKLEFRRAATANVTLPTSPINVTATGRRVKELSPDDVASLRFALDRALQPVDAWNGFHFGDQWQPAATRYQVNTMGWALALVNHNSLPAMRSYLQEAQLNLIEKAKDHKLWWYWRWENMWGNLRWNADPMPIDNIMYSGYLGMQIGMYQAATGDLRHDEAGAFTLLHPKGDRFVYDFHRITEIVAAQYNSDFCMWPCEPNMIYPSCNIYGAIGVAAYDAAHGTDYWKQIEPQFKRKLREEFTLVDGTIITLKSKYTGLSLLGGGVPSLLTVAAFMPPLLRDVGALQWAMAKGELFNNADAKPRRSRKAPAGNQFERDLVFPDPGNYKRSHTFILSCMLMGAGELGDHETYAQTIELREKLAPAQTVDGVLYHPDASIWTNSHMMMGRFSDTNGLHDLVRKGASHAWRDGPLLVRADYPDVLVAKAVSDDGVALELVLYPGSTRTTQTIGIGQLKPGVTYRVCVDGTDIGAIQPDRSGEADVTVELRGRTPVLLVPTSA